MIRPPGEGPEPRDGIRRSPIMNSFARAGFDRRKRFVGLRLLSFVRMYTFGKWSEQEPSVPPHSSPMGPFPRNAQPEVTFDRAAFRSCTTTEGWPKANFCPALCWCRIGTRFRLHQKNRVINRLTNGPMIPVSSASSDRLHVPGNGWESRGRKAPLPALGRRDPHEGPAVEAPRLQSKRCVAAGRAGL